MTQQNETVIAQLKAKAIQDGNELIAAMKEKELVATLSEIAGDEAIATVVARTVLASDMLALDNTYDAQLSYIPETEPNIPEAERDESILEYRPS